MSTDKVRLDKYLWAIRIFKTRSLATKAIDDGKVKLDGEGIKPSRNVMPGDTYEIKTSARKWLIKVTGVIQNRVKFEEAVKHYEDMTSEEDKQLNRRLNSSFYTGKRQSKTGRPTKKQRRDLNEFFDED